VIHPDHVLWPWARWGFPRHVLGEGLRTCSLCLVVERRKTGGGGVNEVDAERERAEEEEKESNTVTRL